MEPKSCDPVCHPGIEYAITDVEYPVTGVVYPVIISRCRVSISSYKFITSFPIF